jgi:hypothetical protein
MNSRRFMSATKLRRRHPIGSGDYFDRAETGIKIVRWCATNVRFGSKADMRSAKGHVRFAHNSDRESGFPQTAMSALPPIADICSAQAHVRFVPIADMAQTQVQFFISSRTDGLGVFIS